MDRTHDLQSRLGGWATTTIADACREVEKVVDWGLGIAGLAWPDISSTGLHFSSIRSVRSRLLCTRGSRMMMNDDHDEMIPKYGVQDAAHDRVQGARHEQHPVRKTPVPSSRSKRTPAPRSVLSQCSDNSQRLRRQTRNPRQSFIEIVQPLNFGTWRASRPEGNITTAVKVIRKAYASPCPLRVTQTGTRSRPKSIHHLFITREGGSDLQEAMQLK